MKTKAARSPKTTKPTVEPAREEPVLAEIEQLARRLAQAVRRRPPVGARRTEAQEVLLEADLDGFRFQLLRSAPPSRRSHHPLSTREEEVLELIARDYTSPMVAVALGISEWTVATHVRRALLKLGVSTRAAAVAEVLGGANHAAPAAPPRRAPARAAAARRLAVALPVTG